MTSGQALARSLTILLVVAAGFVLWRASKGETPAQTFKALREVSPGNREAPEELIETVDVGDSIDSRIDLEDDVRAAARAEGFVGVLPGDFPHDIYIYEPSFLLDFGNDPGNRFIRLRIRRPLKEVASTYSSRLRSDGWSGPALSGTPATLKKGARSIRVDIVEQSGDSLVRIGY